MYICVGEKYRVITLFGKVWSVMIEFFRSLAYSHWIKKTDSWCNYKKPNGPEWYNVCTEELIITMLKRQFIPNRLVWMSRYFFFYLQPQLTFIQVEWSDGNSNLTIKRLWCRKSFSCLSESRHHCFTSADWDLKTPPKSADPTTEWQ